MKLHQDKKLFRQAVQFTAQQMNIPDIYIEKDYWVTFVLFTLYKNRIGKETVFKGGTSLSKCFGLIDRFSEDIDLVVLRKEGESNNQLKNKIKKITDVVSAVLPEVEIVEVTRKRGMSRKTAHTYTKEFNGNYGQIRDVIIVEATWLGNCEPYSLHKISSYIYEMMKATNQEELAKEKNLLPFDVFVLDPRRTICEKIMSLVRFSYSEQYIEKLKNKVRHIYDLHQILQQKEFLEFINSNDFEKMLLKVATDDILSFKTNNEWLAFHPNESKFFGEIKTIWESLRITYEGTFKQLVYGSFPNATEVFKTIEFIKRRLSSIKWTIEIK